MDRTILHIDMNNCYASIEAVYNPALKGKPVAVVGDPEARHGIVLAKSQEAKLCGVTTGNPIWKAKKDCPDIILIPPHYDWYLKHSRMAKAMYYEYTDLVETLGLDECWLDVTGSLRIFGSGKAIADDIRARMKETLGVSVSIGVSWNKMFAKLGSDYKKPDATTVFNREDMETIIWNLPVSDMWGSGWATTPKLHALGIFTIGDLARTSADALKAKFGVFGHQLWAVANGHDISAVHGHESDPIKSFGNSTTTPRDLKNEEDIKITLYVLAESVAKRMREQKFKCRTVQIWIRYSDMSSFERQGTLSQPVSNSQDIFDMALALFRENRERGRAIRGLGVRGCNLESGTYVQEGFLPEQKRSLRRDDLENSIDSLRSRYGHFVVQRGKLMTDTSLSGFDPGDNVGFMNT